MDQSEWVGLVAGLLTTLAYVPQAMKCWRTGSARDFSMPMLVMLIAGLALWFASGVLRGSVSLVMANGVTIVLASFILAVKLRRG